MFKKTVIFVSLILLSLAFADIVFGTQTDVNDTKGDSIFENVDPELILFTDIFESPNAIEDGIDEVPAVPWTEPYLDADGDGLTNFDELKYGTNPLLADTDDDFIIDSYEILKGTNPVSWDTDGDRLADYVEIIYSKGDGGTNPFEADSDHDGLPDPWEDNDGDTIVNIEEQDPKFKYGILGSNPNTIDSDGDTISDDDEIQCNAAGPISKNSADIAGWTQLSVTPDRSNADLDVSDHNGRLSKHLKSLGWTDADLDWWDQGLEDAYKHGVFGEWNWNNSCTVWYHYTPWLWPMPTDYDWNASTPYRWNKYDSNPAMNDTDGDVMDDDWDPRPLIPDDRLDAYLAITKITHNSIDYSALPPGNQNFSAGFDANFSAVEVTKGDQITLTLWLGLESTPSNDPIKIPNLWWKPLNISIWFGSFLLGADNKSHGDIGADDLQGDDLWPDINNTNLPSIPDKPWVSVGAANYKTSDTFFNSSGMSSTMYFYEQIITIYLPADLPAGLVGFIVRANPNTGENFYYETYKWPFVGY